MPCSDIWGDEPRDEIGMPVVMLPVDAEDMVKTGSPEDMLPEQDDPSLLTTGRPEVMLPKSDMPLPGCTGRPEVIPPGSW